VPVVSPMAWNDFMNVTGLPTVIILDRAGKSHFRMDGFPTKGFTEDLTTAIQEALGPAN